MVAAVSQSSQSHHRVMMQGFGDSCPSHTLNPFKAHCVASWLWGIKSCMGGEKIGLYLILLENPISGAAAGGSHGAEPISGTLGG